MNCSEVEINIWAAKSPSGAFSALEEWAVPERAATGDKVITKFDLISMKEGDNPKTPLSKLDVAANELAQFISPKYDEGYDRQLIRNLTNFYET